ncbi:MAG TPA: penicillin-binding protein 1C [Candidatus Rubrimentiphilum sp.]|nr:penicillin-binding protein 1C [Candidatus Rubrimentiphilum sp.]
MRRTSWVILAALITVLGLAALNRLFAVPAVEARSTAVAFTDRSGIPLGAVLSTGAESSVAVPLERVSPFFLQAIVATEDRRFYQHGAVDWLALGRAAWQTARCLCSAGGASTITMQLARTQFDLPSGIRGKLLQMWDAARIEAGSSKGQILNAYVNRIAMGGNTYGVEAAARTYFGVPASDLDLAQAAMLAGIPNDPARLNPRTHWRAARARQRAVLDAMVAGGFISAEQAAIAARETLHVRAAGGELKAAQQLLFRLAAAGHLTVPVRTTIDLPLQRFVQSQAQDVVAALAGRNVTQASALVVDNRTGDVLAYLGSTDYFNDAYLGQNDGVRTLRQPGSTLKPFLYEYALEQRTIRPYTILADVPTTYAIPNGELYAPEDYSTQFAGPVPVRIALANSLNVPAVRVLSKVGVGPFLDRLQALGFADLRRAPDYYGLGLTLGAGEVTLWDLTHAYVTLARGGSAIPLRTVLDQSAPGATQIGDRASWELVADMLGDRYARAKSFGIGSVIDTPFPSLVKTGTSSDYRDTWTVGATPEYTVAVWVGNFSGAPMRRIAGVSGAGPLWNRIMLHLYEHRDPPRFPAPAGYHVARIGALQEYVDTADLRTMHAARPAPIAAAYDEWRARQGDTTGALSILFPHDGDIFEDTLSPNDARRAQQRIEFRISRARGARVAWTLNGSSVASGTGDAYFWPVRAGEWTLAVRSGKDVRTVHFAVIRRPHHGPRGFSVAGLP